MGERDNVLVKTLRGREIEREKRFHLLDMSKTYLFEKTKQQTNVKCQYKLNWKKQSTIFWQFVYTPSFAVLNELTNLYHHTGTIHHIASPSSQQSHPVHTATLAKLSRIVETKQKRWKWKRKAVTHTHTVNSYLKCRFFRLQCAIMLIWEKFLIYIYSLGRGEGAGGENNSHVEFCRLFPIIRIRRLL